ncbi:MAG: hypothetical protein LBE21_05445 [Pseudomonadales bacterium]|jgi:hypothetical protein|nr:hypothetical protein [Pseudomonadales bacterium]
MRAYQIDCRQIRSYGDFIEACNKGFIESLGGKWNGNLDAFNDYLSWPEPSPCQLTILGAERCAKVLDYPRNERDETSLWVSLKGILLENKEWVHVTFQ